MEGIGKNEDKEEESKKNANKTMWKEKLYSEKEVMRWKQGVRRAGDERIDIEREKWWDERKERNLFAGYEETLSKTLKIRDEKL